MNTLKMDAYDAFHHGWALLTAGEPGNFNTMTISWGGVGCLWGKSVATVYVRPSRYTYEFMEQYEYFTVSFYPEDCKKALGILGKYSGRDCDKIAMAGLDPVPIGEAVTFAQAKTTLLCKKLYWQDMIPENVPADVREKHYKGIDDYHRFYIGEVLAVHSED